MVKIVTFEGSDYSGKTATSKYLSEKVKGRFDAVYNSGVIYPCEESSRICELTENVDDLMREILYTTAFMLDKQKDAKIKTKNPRIILQDRYWQSVVAYGRFLNGEKSVHRSIDMKELFISTTAVVYLKCSVEEKIRRNSLRNKKSVVDRFLLAQPERLESLESEIESSLKTSKNVFIIETTNKPIEEVASIVEILLKKKGIFQ